MCALLLFSRLTGERFEPQDSTGVLKVPQQQLKGRQAGGQCRGSVLGRSRRTQRAAGAGVAQGGYCASGQRQGGPGAAPGAGRRGEKGGALGRTCCVPRGPGDEAAPQKRLEPKQEGRRINSLYLPRITRCSEPRWPDKPGHRIKREDKRSVPSSPVCTYVATPLTAMAHPLLSLAAADTGARCQHVLSTRRNSFCRCASFIRINVCE